MGECVFGIDLLSWSQSQDLLYFVSKQIPGSFVRGRSGDVDVDVDVDDS